MTLAHSFFTIPVNTKVQRSSNRFLDSGIRRNDELIVSTGGNNRCIAFHIHILRTMAQQMIH